MSKEQGSRKAIIVLILLIVVFLWASTNSDASTGTNRKKAYAKRRCNGYFIDKYSDAPNINNPIVFNTGEYIGEIVGTRDVVFLNQNHRFYYEIEENKTLFVRLLVGESDIEIR